MREKVCTKCKQVKPLGAFHKHPQGRGGRQTICKECNADPSDEEKKRRREAKRRYAAKPESKKKKTEAGRLYYLQNKEEIAKTHELYRLKNKKKIAKAMREYNLFRNFGMTVGDYDRILAKQHGCCAICRKMPRKTKLSVDHNHETGEVRGLLCCGCNLMLGNAQENSTVLRLAAIYLEEHNSERE